MAWSQLTPYTTTGAATIANVLAGTAVEYVGAAATLTLYGSGDAAGDTFSLSGYTGSHPGQAFVPSGSPVPVASTAGSLKTNENFIGQFAVPANTRLVLTLVASAAHTGRFQLVIG